MEKILNYAARCQAAWDRFYRSLGHEPKTTFFGDLTIAELFGEAELRNFVESTFKTWGGNIVYITEFVVCLNHKIGYWFEKDEPLARIYNDLWINADERVINLFEGNEEAISYYFKITD